MDRTLFEMGKIIIPVSHLRGQSPRKRWRSGLNLAGIILKSNPAAEHWGFAAPKWFRPRRQGIISNGVKDRK